jgi:hypothetical protein
MTTRELYSSIGVSGCEHQQCWRKDGVFHLRMAAPGSCYRCSQCGNRDVIRRGTVDRVVHAPPIGMERTQLFIKVPRLECRRCERVLNAVLPNVVPLCNYTKSLARLVVDLRKMMTIRDVTAKAQFHARLEHFVGMILCRPFYGSNYSAPGQQGWVFNGLLSTASSTFAMVEASLNTGMMTERFMSCLSLAEVRADAVQIFVSGLSTSQNDLQTLGADGLVSSQ